MEMFLFRSKYALIEKEMMERNNTNSCVGNLEYTGKNEIPSCVPKIFTKKFTTIKQSPEPIM